MGRIAIRATSLIGLAMLIASGGPARAADSLIQGKRLIVKNPSGSEDNRTLIVLGKERPTDNVFNNFPHPVTATLRVILNGDDPSDVTYTLGPPGVWQHSGPGFSGVLKYTGGDPVKLLYMKFNPASTPSFLLKAKLKGSAGPQSLDSVPPNQGTEGGIIFTMDQGDGDQRFCVSFGGAAGGTSSVNTGEMWKVSNAIAATACPAPIGEPESVSQGTGADGTVSSDTEANGAQPFDPLETAVTTPNAGTVSIQESTATDPDPTGYDLVGQHADLTAPPALGTDPLILVFLVDSTAIPAGRDPSTLTVFRDGAAVENCVGPANTAFPDPCVSERTTVGDDHRITVLSTHASRWTFGMPLCGNGMVDGGETCEPVGVQAQCNPGETCKANCQCAPACDCCALGAATYELTTAVGGGICGAATDINGMVFTNLACNGIYFGGGGNTIPPAVVPDQVTLKLAISSCDSATERLTLGPASAALTGSTRTCTTAGCSFGAPVAIPNAMSIPTSSCVTFTVAQDASGTSSCEGDANVSLPLTAGIFLTGDTAHDPGGTIPGIQSCPVCSGGTCIGGPNNGMACVAANTAINASYPTSQDCPPDPMFSVGTIPIGTTFTSGSATAEARQTGVTNGKLRVFCGYCRDDDGTGAFQSPAQPCETDADCGSPVYESCSQRSNGAFGPNGGAVKTISITGARAGCLADGGVHASTLVGATCVGPTYNAIVDLSADFPGPGVLSLEGGAQLAAPPPACTCGSPAPTTLTYTNAIGAGNCGTARTAAGATFKTLACGGLYFGGGGQSFPLPETTLEGTSVTNVSFCSGNSLTLAAASAAETGSSRTCTKAGCLFGPPLPVPNAGSPATSFCIMSTLSQDAVGAADCATGATNLDLSLSQAIYLTGDTGTDPTSSMAGIQPCPICSGGTCRGGPNNGMSCTAGADLGDSWPTTHDCPPDPMFLIGSMPFPYSATTGNVTWTGSVATNDVVTTAADQTRTFCGFCRDRDNTTVFQNPAKPCWQNGMAVGTACTQPNETCEQRTNGAFGPNGGAVLTITEAGTPAGSLADHLAHAATLASAFCVSPTFDATVDAALDLPGPGAVTLQGTVQVQ